MDQTRNYGVRMVLCFACWIIFLFIPACTGSSGDYTSFFDMDGNRVQLGMTSDAWRQLYETGPNQAIMTVTFYENRLVEVNHNLTGEWNYAGVVDRSTTPETLQALLGDPAWQSEYDGVESRVDGYYLDRQGRPVDRDDATVAAAFLWSGDRLSGFNVADPMKEERAHFAFENDRAGFSFDLSQPLGEIIERVGEEPIVEDMSFYYKRYELPDVGLLLYAVGDRIVGVATSDTWWPLWDDRPEASDPIRYYDGEGKLTDGQREGFSYPFLTVWCDPARDGYPYRYHLLGFTGE